MKIRELRRQLENFDEEADVAMVDGEGEYYGVDSVEEDDRNRSNAALIMGDLQNEE